MKEKSEYLIIGSGAGGATLANELTKRGKSVSIVEVGKQEEKIGTFRDATRYYDSSSKLTRTPSHSREGVILWRTLMAGGSTVVSCGNGGRCLEQELSVLGINLEAEFTEAEAELHIAPIAERLLSDGSREIMRASKELGYCMEPMPKFIDPKKCRKCGQCVLGCSRDAKWTALNYLEEAVNNGAHISYGLRCSSVVVENGQAKGIRATGPSGEVELRSDVVILAAGGLGTPQILLKSGIDKAGTGLFMDLLVNTYGITDGLNLSHEPAMTLVNHDFYESNGFILSPYVNHPRMVKFMEFGIKGLTMRDSQVVGIMTKIRDESAGQVYPDGAVSKSATDKDWEKLREGSRISTEILRRMGVKKTMVSKVEGAHPGGTAAIGAVVDNNLQTGIDNLFICDASVLPTSPGFPPILTIVALTKRLARFLAP